MYLNSLWREARRKFFCILLKTFDFQKVCVPPWRFRKIIEFSTYCIFLWKIEKKQKKNQKKTEKKNKKKETKTKKTKTKQRKTDTKQKRQKQNKK